MTFDPGSSNEAECENHETELGTIKSARMENSADPQHSKTAFTPNLPETRDSKHEVSPPHTLTSDPREVTETQDELIDTEQGNFLTHPSSKVQATANNTTLPAPSTKQQRAKKSKHKRNDEHFMEEVDQSECAERMLLAMQNIPEYCMDDTESPNCLESEDEHGRTFVNEDNQCIEETYGEQGLVDGEPISNIKKCRDEIMDIESNNSYNVNTDHSNVVAIV